MTQFDLILFDLSERRLLTKMLFVLDVKYVGKSALFWLQQVFVGLNVYVILFYCTFEASVCDMIAGS